MDIQSIMKIFDDTAYVRMGGSPDDKLNSFTKSIFNQIMHFLNAFFSTFLL